MEKKTFQILITGSTGMVGKGVLLEALESAQISTIYLINRKPLGISHQKIKEILLPDFSEIARIKSEINAVDACFHCMGVSAVRLTESEYSHLTFDVSRDLANICYEINPQMTFVYVSGQGTDSSEKGSVMWARVKGKTENYLLNKGFGKAIMFRPGVILPEKGVKSRTPLYNTLYFIMRPFFPLMRMSPSVTSSSRLGKAMLNSLSEPSVKSHLLNKDINILSEKTL